jgi:translation initiation factor IF-1
VSPQLDSQVPDSRAAVYNTRLGLSRSDREGAPAGRPAVEATVVEALPSALYAVRLGTGHRILAHVSPEARLHFIRIVPGDRVRVEVSPYDEGRGRIVEHLKG